MGKHTQLHVNINFLWFVNFSKGKIQKLYHFLYFYFEVLILVIIISFKYSEDDIFKHIKINRYLII